ADRSQTEVDGGEGLRVGGERDDVSDTGSWWPSDAGTSRAHTRGGERVVERLLGLREDVAAVPQGRLGGLDREQDTPLRIDVQVAFGRGCQAASVRQTRIVRGVPAQNERDDGEQRGRGGKQGETCKDSSPSSSSSTCRLVRHRPGLREKFALADR